MKFETREAVLRSSLLTVIVLLLGACASSRPFDDVGFDAVGSLQDLNGTYLNQGETGPGTPPLYLSAIIWPRDADLHHEAITEIEVHALDRKTLLVWALGDSGIVKEQEFIEGRHFEFRSGRLHLKSDFGVAGTESGEPVLGVESEAVEVGVDQRGDGKLRVKQSVAGLAYMVVPFAGGESHEVRFRRTE